MLVSCVPDSRVSRPADVLTEKEMQAVLADYYLAESFGDRETAEGKNEFVVNQAHISGVLQKHNISSLRFFKSLSWYQQQPELFEPMHNAIIQDLSRLQAEMKTKP